MNEIDEHGCSANKVCEHGMYAIFSDEARGHSETFYFNCAKNCVPRVVRTTLDQLSCSVGIWDM